MMDRGIRTATRQPVWGPQTAASALATGRRLGITADDGRRRASAVELVARRCACGARSRTSILER
jgi:hypothetical protein